MPLEPFVVVSFAPYGRMVFFDFGGHAAFGPLLLVDILGELLDLDLVLGKPEVGVGLATFKRHHLGLKGLDFLSLFCDLLCLYFYSLIRVLLVLLKAHVEPVHLIDFRFEVQPPALLLLHVMLVLFLALPRPELRLLSIHDRLIHLHELGLGLDNPLLHGLAVFLE